DTRCHGQSTARPEPDGNRPQFCTGMAEKRLVHPALRSKPAARLLPRPERIRPQAMRAPLLNDLYSPREIAAAAGVPEELVTAALGCETLLAHADAVRLGRALRRGAAVPRANGRLFSIFASELAPHRKGMTLAM